LPRNVKIVISAALTSGASKTTHGRVEFIYSAGVTRLRKMTNDE
jgi:hypothetical protein